MNREEIRQFKSLLNQGILRHENILLDYKFQSSLLEIIKDYEQLQQENKQLKEDINNIVSLLNKNCDDLEGREKEFDSLHKWSCVKHNEYYE